MSWQVSRNLQSLSLNSLLRQTPCTANSCFPKLHKEKMRLQIDTRARTSKVLTSVTTVPTGSKEVNACIQGVMLMLQESS